MEKEIQGRARLGKMAVCLLAAAFLQTTLVWVHS